jgi:hypothetical protein
MLPSTTRTLQLQLLLLLLQPTMQPRLQLLLQCCLWQQLRAAAAAADLLAAAAHPLLHTPHLLELDNLFATAATAGTAAATVSITDAEN